MKIDKFEMMRMECLYENLVDYNLSESGVLPMRLSELFDGPGDPVSWHQDYNRAFHKIRKGDFYISTIS
jgi:hypothetical protein